MILKFWNWLSNLGVSEEHAEENALIRSYNRMSFISAMGVLEMMFAAWFLEFSNTYILIISLIFVIYLGAIYLNGIGEIQKSRYLISIGSPTWVSLAFLFMGGYFNQGLAIIASMMITYVAFQKDIKIKRAILLYHLLIFFTAYIFVHFQGPILGVIDFPFDEVVVFIGGLGWTIIVLFTFDKDRENLIEDLRNNNIELQNTTEELERFTYIASHDLKSPLRTITSFIGLIERDIKKEKFDGLQEKLHFVKTGAEQMNFLVQDILELSHLKSLEQAERTELDLNLVLEKAKTNLTEEIAQKNVIINAEHLPSFYGNEIEFLLLFQNFIQNGIKYNNSDRPIINITTYQKEDVLNLSFRDNGIGIEEKYYDLIFQFFKRLHNSNEYQGTGLGLGVCKKIINNYKGTVEIDSLVGSGTTFTISFPNKKLSSPSAPAENIPATSFME